MRVGIIGATGWLGSALGRGLLAQGLVTAPDLMVSNRSGPRADYYGHAVRWARDTEELVDFADVVVLSLRPEDWPALNLRAEGKLVLSFMAGVDSATLARSAGRIVRAMPNAAAEIGASYSPFWAAASVTEADRTAVQRILSAIGTTDELAAEGHIDLMTAVPGSGAAYPALMAVAMSNFLRQRGVDEDIAWRATEAAVCGGAAMLAGQVTRVPRLLAAYHDYRGTTDAGLLVAEAAGFTTSLAQALSAATEKAYQMTTASAGL